MYFLNKFCCICMNKSDLQHLFNVDNKGVSHYNKLTSSIAEMDFKEMNDQRLICGECCVTLNTVYNFRQTCLRSKTNLIKYISLLQTFSKVSGTLSVRLTDIKHNMIIVKKEIEIKCENEDSSSSFVENNPQSECKTESYEEDIQFPASVKEECESEEDAGPAHEDAAVDHMNEGAHSDVEDETNMQDEDYMEFSEIDIEEDPLAVVKEEPMSDSETPSDGSTSQANAGTSEEPKNCEICKKIFISKSLLTRHMLIHSGGKAYECEICKKKFSLKGNLTKHMPIHSGEKPYVCVICKKAFTQNSNLKDHTRIHFGVRSFKCNICKKSFKQKRTLESHMKIHTDERKYACEICPKKYIQKYEFERHMQVHSGKSPYVCEICKKSFLRKHAWSTHMLIHSGERPYECEICKKSFTQKSNLSKHLHIHSGKKPFECEICRKTFSQRSNLTKHLQRCPAKVRPS